MTGCAFSLQSLTLRKGTPTSPVEVKVSFLRNDQYIFDFLWRW